MAVDATINAASEPSEWLMVGFNYQWDSYLHYFFIVWSNSANSMREFNILQFRGFFYDQLTELI